MIRAPFTTVAVLMIEVGIGSLFVQAATGKALRPERTLAALRALGLRGSRWTLASLIGFEGAIGAALCAGWALDITMPAAAVALTAFTAALIALRLKRYRGECGCSSLASVPAPELRNLILIGAIAMAMLVRPDMQDALRETVRVVMALLLVLSITSASIVLAARRDRLAEERWEV